MKVKLKNKDNPMKALYCFNNKGFCQTTFDNINAGKEVQVDRVPYAAWEYIEKVEKKVKKTKKTKKQEVGNGC